MSILGTTGIESERQGLVAGLLTTAQQIGAAIGVGVASVELYYYRKVPFHPF
ncbi:hypothetical protein [Methanobacterium sp.]|uniref:hypothetical protein n=1 Tax=Methanobacterium sp. TaxID=2164 RepID=UPI003C74B286